MKNDTIVLQTTALPPHTEQLLAQTFQTIRWPPGESDRCALLEKFGHQIRAIATTGKGPVSGELIESLPNLQIIASYSAGLDGIDTSAAERKGVKVTNTSHILCDDVADIALWLTIGLARRLVAADRYVRAGAWCDGAFPLARSVRGLKVGILGLGHIGQAIAQRLSGCGAEIGYHNRNPKPEVAYPYFDQLSSLARWCDGLVVCCPGGAQTHHLVDQDILCALGSEGFIVNIARGSIVDEAALLRCLEDGEIHGAGLDVFADEPHIPERLRQDDRVILLPHLGSGTFSTRLEMGCAMVGALVDHFTVRHG